MKPKVAFICVHNSCRSQMAETIAKLRYGSLIDVYSAGTEKKDSINEDAVRLIKKHYDFDMTQFQRSKTLDEIPPVDIVITMGCNVDCPWLPSKHREDWGLDDPSGQSDEVFEATITAIEKKLDHLMLRIKNKEVNVD